MEKVTNLWGNTAKRLKSFSNNFCRHILFLVEKNAIKYRKETIKRLERWLSYSEDWLLLLRPLPGFQDPQDHLQMQLWDLMLFPGSYGHVHIHTVNQKVLK